MIACSKFFYWIPFFLLISCSSYRYIDIQVLNPGLIKLPQNVTDLLIVDPRVKGKDSSQSVLRNSQHIPYYDIILNSFNAQFKSKVKQSPPFNETNISFLKRDIVADSLTVILSQKRLPLLLKVNFRVFLDTSYARIKEVYGHYVVYYKFQFELSNLDTKEIIDWFQTSDTYARAKLQSVDDGSGAFADISKKVAEKYAQRIAPYWTTEERMLIYSGNRLMRKGYELFCKNDLAGSIGIWEKLYNVGTKHLGTKAAYNLAVSYEMLDDLDLCEKWLVNSIQIKPNEKKSKYLEIIRKRKLDRLTLEKQVP